MRVIETRLKLILALLMFAVLAMPTLADEEVFRGIAATGFLDPMHFISDLAVSPDGSSIIFTAHTSNYGGDGCINTNKICLVDPSVESIWFDAHAIIPSGANPDWSSDGTKIVYLNTDEDCWMFSDPATGENTHYSPDVYVMDEHGVVNQIVDTDQNKYRPQWSPDGRKIAYYATSFGNNYIYVVDADGTNMTKLTPGVKPNWSPDGTKIVYEHEDHVYVMDSYGANITKLYNEPAKGALWSPDGKKIAFCSGEIVVADIIGSNFTSIGVKGNPEAWFSDSERLLFTSSDHVGIVSADGSDMSTLVVTSLNNPKVALSPDDKMVYYTETERPESVMWISINKIDIAYLNNL